MKLLNARIPISTGHSSGLQAVILDWAGTAVDFGSLAPVRTLQQVFARFQVEVSEQQARHEMGIPKRDHIARLLSMPEIISAWSDRHGHPPDHKSIDDVYAWFIPLQLACLAEYSSVIPGVVEAVARARARGLKIGSTTGYTRPMLDSLAAQAATQGYLPDCSVAPEDVGSGRPKPFMIFEAATRLDVYPLASIVKIGDTPSDIQEGLNAGVWSVGVARTGNMIGLSQNDLEALPIDKQERLVKEAHHQLQAAGAHFVIDSVADMDAVLDQIDRLLADSASYE